MGYLEVRKEEIKRVHLDEISNLIIESTAVSLTAALLCELTKRKINVIFCDEKRNPSSELLPFYGSFDTSVKIRNQIQWTEIQKKIIWTEIISEKIRKQAELLKLCGRCEFEMLENYIAEIKIGDSTNREGHAAKVYFNALFGKQFTRTEECCINAALNYGYGIILSAFNREIVANGYLTQIGLFHDNMFNPYNLGSDLMEPFRPIVDEQVAMMQPEKFEHDEKIRMLQILQRDVVIGGRHEIVDHAIKIYCKSVFDALEANDSSLIKFYKN